MPRKYAATTTVPAEKSIAEVIRFLHGRGCDKVMPYSSPDQVVVQFEWAERLYRFGYAVPPLDHFAPKRPIRDDARYKATARQQERDRLWRVLFMKLKMSFEEVDEGYGTRDQVFLPYIVLPNNATVAEAMTPLIAYAYAQGRMPAINSLLLPAPQEQS